MSPNHRNSVETSGTDPHYRAPIEDFSGEDEDEDGFLYDDSDTAQDESGLAASSSLMIDDFHTFDVGNIVLDVKGLHVKFEVCPPNYL